MEKEKSKFDRLAEKIEAGETKQQLTIEEIKRKWHNLEVICKHYFWWFILVVCIITVICTLIANLVR